MNSSSIYIFFFISFIFCNLAFTSCSSEHSAFAELQQAKAFMEITPDSALTILHNIQSPEMLPSSEYAAYCLLITQAQDKNYIVITTDSLIKKAVVYYEKQNDTDLLAVSYYYMGRVYFDMQDAMQAQQCYLKALELAGSIGLTDLLVKINNSLGTLYSYQDVYEMALPLYKKTLSLLEGSNDSTRISLALRNSARVFSETHQLDSAIYYYLQAIKFVTPESISSLQNDLGSLYLKKRQYEEASYYIRNAMQTCINPDLKYHIDLTYGEYLLKTAQYDSARYYLNQSLQSPNLYTQAGSLYFLAQLERQKSDLVNYFRYRDLYEQLRDSIEEDSHFENIRMVQSMFDYQNVVNEKNIYQNQATQRMIIIYQILIITLILIIAGYSYIVTEKKKKKKQIALKEELYNESQQHIEDNKKKIELLENELANGQETLSEVNRQLFETRKLMLEMENRQITLKHDTLELLEQDFKGSTLYIKLQKGTSGLSESEWSELSLLIDATYTDFTKRILTLSQRISIEELRICYLVKIGIPVKRIANLMNLTSSGVSQCRRRLYKKFTQNPESAEKFDQFILDL